MNKEIKLMDVVALVHDLPDKGLVQGQVGTVVEQLAPKVFEVEFSDNSGRTYATGAIDADSLIVLHYENAQTG